MDRLDNPEIHTRIERLRTDLGMTQPEFATALGMDPKKGRSTINNWETRANKIKDDDLKHIAETFHVSADWLLGLSDVRSPDADMQAVCQYTGLSESAICVLKLGNTAPHAINLLANPYTAQSVQEEWSALNSPLWKFASALVRLEHSAIPAIIKAVQNDPDMDYFEVVSKKEGVEVALYRFEKACRDIPPAVFFTDTALDELNSMEQKLYQKKYREFQNSQTEEAQHGEHTES